MLPYFIDFARQVPDATRFGAPDQVPLEALLAGLAAASV
jgi:hypothetical protein